MTKNLPATLRDDTKLSTTGDARRAILDTIQALRNGDMDVGRGMAIAANMKVLNDAIFAECKMAQMVITAKAAGMDFGKMVQMGQRKINGE